VTVVIVFIVLKRRDFSKIFAKHKVGKNSKEQAYDSVLNHIYSNISQKKLAMQRDFENIGSTNDCQGPGSQLKENDPNYKTVTINEIVENTETDDSPKITENILDHHGPEFNQPRFNSQEDDNYSVVYAQLNKGKNDLCIYAQPNKGKNDLCI